jgi:hypothetical protein
VSTLGRITETLKHKEDTIHLCEKLNEYSIALSSAFANDTK